MANEFIEKMLEKVKKRNEFRENIMYSTEYIDWLDEFSKKQGAFSNDTKDVSEEDKENVEKIELLVEIVSEYAETNYIEPTYVDYGAYYSIQHNGVGYNIGVDTGQGTSFYCVRLEKPIEGSLEFKHVMSTVKLPKTLLIEDKLDQLASLIEKISSQDVPLSAIQQTTEETVQKIKVKREEKK